MTDRGVSDSDMPTFPWPNRPEAQALDALLSGNCQPEEVPADLRPVAEVLVALQAPPDRREVAGWGQALTVYREVAARPPDGPDRLSDGREPRPEADRPVRQADHRVKQADRLIETGKPLEFRNSG